MEWMIYIKTSKPKGKDGDGEKKKDFGGYLQR